MNWDKDFLAKPSPTTLDITASTRRLSIQEEQLVDDIMQTVKDLSNPEPSMEMQSHGESSNPYAKLSERDRIRIKRRKLGKFIGLVGMETPVEEIAGRLQASIDRAVERSRKEQQECEDFMMRRRKVG